MRRLLLLSLAFIPILAQQGASVICHAPMKKIVTIVNPKEAHCLAVTIFGEARGESELGQVAVAFTAVNRAVKKTVCKVVLAPKQYSIFNGNAALKAAAMSLHLEPKQKNVIDKASWDRAVKVANDVLSKQVVDPTSGSTHYVAYKSLKHIPHWTRKFVVMAKIDNHTFFKDPKAISVAAL